MDLGAWASGEYSIAGSALDAPLKGESLAPEVTVAGTRDATRH